MAYGSEKARKDISVRLNRIEGQVRGINKMISDGVYCDDIIHQVASVEAALAGVKKLLLESHLRHCIVERLKSGEYEVIDEFMTTLGKILK